jgi:hypothetical protein
MTTTLLLVCANIFMTIAWYGHLKYKNAPLFAVIVVSWLIAFAEYCFQVPANRIGYDEFTAFQLKIIQEVIPCVFSWPSHGFTWANTFAGTTPSHFCFSSARSYLVSGGNSRSCGEFGGHLFDGHPRNLPIANLQIADLQLE